MDEIIDERKKKIIERNHMVNAILEGIEVAGTLTSPLRYIQLPEFFTGKSFEICAKEVGVQVYGAERFVVGSTPAPKAIRIAVTTPATIEQLAEGVERLRKLLLYQ